MTTTYFNPEEIKKAVGILKPDGQIFEVRIIHGKKVSSGYFKDAEKLLLQLSKTDLKNANVYITLHRVHEGCSARMQWERFLESDGKTIPTTSDSDITAYSYIPIDLDPVRPAGISSSEEELQAADELRYQIAAYMKDQGFNKSIQAFSGNGYHLLYEFNEPKSKKATGFVQGCLNRLDELFSNNRCKVDTGNFNPSRVFKLYGTLAQKGRNTKDRPHRISKILEVEGLEST